MAAGAAPALTAPLQSGTHDVSLTVQGLLAEPSTRMVVVDFFSTNCPPCVKAIPRWERLKRDYGARGLRLVVVAEEKAQACTTSQWAPDHWLCDEDNATANAWGALYGHAYVWTWQGRLTHEKITIDEVEALVDRVFKDSLRIEVAPPVDSLDRPLDEATARGLLEAVMRVLQQQTRFELLPGDRLAAQLREVRAQRQGAGYAGNTTCTPGEDLAPNSVLLIRLGADNLAIEIHSLANLCAMDSESMPLRGRPPAEVAR